jgi:hypothetical protein
MSYANGATVQRTGIANGQRRCAAKALYKIHDFAKSLRQLSESDGGFLTELFRLALLTRFLPYLTLLIPHMLIHLTLHASTSPLFILIDQNFRAFLFCHYYICRGVDQKTDHKLTHF